MKIYTFKQGNVKFDVQAETPEAALLRINNSAVFFTCRLDCGVGYVSCIQIEIPREFTAEDIVETKDL